MTDEAREVLLDHCIDALLSGGDWELELPPGESRHELLGLVAVGRWLLQLHRQPPADGARRERVWRRVSDRIDLAGHNIVPFLTAPPAAFRPVVSTA